MSLRYSLIIIILLFGFASCKTASNSKNTKTSLFKNEVFACYYHNKFNGRKTASGAVFSNNKLTAAHKTLQFGTKVKVTNIENNKSVIVEITVGIQYQYDCIPIVTNGIVYWYRYLYWY